MPVTPIFQRLEDAVSSNEAFVPVMSRMECVFQGLDTFHFLFIHLNVTAMRIRTNLIVPR